CGTLARPCPKLKADPTMGAEMRGTEIAGKVAPPPCIYLFPRTIPDARNNPKPSPWALSDVRFLDKLATLFGTLTAEVVAVNIEARMKGADVQRRTTYTANSQQLHQSAWTAIRRAR